MVETPLTRGIAWEAIPHLTDMGVTPERLKEAATTAFSAAPGKRHP